MKKPAKGAKPAKKVVHRAPVKPARPGLHAGPLHRPPPAAAKKKAPAHHRAKHHPKRKLALAEGVACCAAEALAASLRLAGGSVSDSDVLALYWLTASGADDGATILATLEAAQVYGLAGARPANFQLLAPELGPSVRGSKFPLILGGVLSGGEHALTLDPSGAVWSWGDLYDPAQLGVTGIDEAWLVDWEAR